MNDMGENREEQENEEYSFLNETVKNPPIDMQRILVKLATLMGAAILFGVIAALVFYAVLSWRNSMSPNPVTIPSDEQTQAAIGNIMNAGDGDQSVPGGSGKKTDDKGAGAAHDDDSGDTSRSDGNDESGDGQGSEGPAVLSPTPTPTEEELDQEALNTYARIQAKLGGIAEETLKSVVTVTGVTEDDEWFDITNVGSNTSSGLIVADNNVSYLILTDSSVVEAADRIAVTLPDDTVVEAGFQKKDPVTGLCVISIPKDKVTGSSRKSLAVATLGNSYNVNQGDTVLAVGAPAGTAGTFACGTVISLEESVAIIDGEYRLMTTDICGGSRASGVLVNMDSKIVGIIEQQYAGDTYHSLTAIPISPLKCLIEKLSNNAALSYIGIHGLDISEKAAESQDIPSGVYVSSVDEDSPALQAGIQPGDIVTEVGLGSSVTLRSLHENIMSRQVGDTVEVKVMRRGNAEYAEFEFTITIGEFPEEDSRPAEEGLAEAEAGEKADESGAESEET